MRFFLRSFVLLAAVLWPGHWAVAQADSLTMADTIHLVKRPVFLTTLRFYHYHYASGLSDKQIVPLLRRSADSTVLGHLRRGHRAQVANVAVQATSYGLILTGLFSPVNSLAQIRTNQSMILGATALLYGSLIPAGYRARQHEQAVLAHNRMLRSRFGQYYVLLYDVSAQVNRLSVNDTIATSRRGLAERYWYRGIRVVPVQQLRPLADQLNDSDVKDGFQYARRVGGIGSLFASLGIAYLAPRLLIYGVQRANGRATTLQSPITWTALAAVGIGYSIRIHAGGVQRRSVRLLNERLRSRYDPTVVGEQFYVP